MADNPNAGGGKIRPRRAAAVRKPYSRASSQRKSLFSRVTDSVKSLLNPITPKWLVSRIGQEEDTQYSERTQDADPDQPSTSTMNHLEESYSRTNNNYKRSPLSRPPLSTSVSHTSTSPLQHFVTPPDTPASEEQIRPSSAAVGKEGLVKHLTMASKRLKLEAGSPVHSDSSFMRNEMKFLSTNDNASVASSSGCSSSVQATGQRTSDNEMGQNPHWSSSLDSLASSGKTSSSRQQATMTSYKRPRFNPAVFGMPSLGVNRYSDLQESSFYEGPVQFGGANASARSPYFASPYKIPSVTKVKVRHVNHQRTPARSTLRTSRTPLDESSAVGMSSTAKKILQTLEKMSSPLNDARKIPTMTRTPSSFAADRRKRRTVAGSSLLKNSLQPPTVGLVSPTPARLRRRSDMPLNNSLLSKKTLEKEKDEPKEYIKERPAQKRVEIVETKSARGLPAPIASMSSSASMPKVRSPMANESPAGGGSGGGGKMKSHKRTSAHYSSMHEEELEEEAPNLPDVPLPVSNLPSFNFAKSMMTSTPSVARPQEKSDKNSNQPEFNFASPLVKTTVTAQSHSSANNTPKFQFSSPPTKASNEGSLDTPKARPLGNFSSGTTLTGQSLVFAPDPKVVSAVKATKRRSSPLATQTSDYSVSDGMKAAESLKSGSVMDILSGRTKNLKRGETPPAMKSSNSSLPPLKKDKFGVFNDDAKNTSAVCESDKTRNEDTKNAYVCESGKQKNEDKPPLSRVFGKNKGWDCQVCMIPNDTDAQNCVACNNPKGGSYSSKSAEKGIGNDKPPLSSIFTSKKGWDCKTCMVPNDADAEKCVACNTVKPGSSAPSKSAFGDTSIFKTGDPKSRPFSFGLPSKNDSNSTAVSNNDASSTKCEPCETIKPGSKPSSTRFQTSTSTSNTAPKFSFGLSSSSSSGSKDTKSSGWGNLAKKPSTTWECEVCMVPNPDERRTCEACDSCKPGTKKELNTSFKFGENSSGLFKFGLPNDKKTDPSEKRDVTSETKEKQTAAPVSDSQTVSKDSNAKDSVPSNPSFSFGVPVNKAPTLPTSTAALAPAFGAPTKNDNAAAPAPTFNFGQKVTPKEAPTGQTLSGTTEPESTAPTFSFGQKSTTSVETVQKDSSDSGTKLPSFAFAAPKKQEPASEPPKLPVFGNTSTTITAFGVTSQSSSTAFGMPKSTIQAPATAQNPPFGAPVSGEPQSKPEEKKSSAAPTFAFGGASSSAGFAFGKSSEQSKESTTSTASNPPTFNFGGTKAAGNDKQPPPAFGLNNIAPASVSNPQQFSGFGNPAQGVQKSLPQNAGPSKPAFVFGSGQNASSSQQSGGVFGSSKAPAASSPFGAQAKPGFAIGSSVAPPFGSSTSNTSGSTNVFGNSTKQEPVFGTPSSNSAQGPSGSSSVFGSGANPSSVFGTPSSGTASQMPKPSFSFGSSNQEQSNNKPAFPFSGSNVTSVPAFGSANPPQQPSTGFNFGSSNKPAFGAAQNTAPSSGFAFGNQSSTQSNGVFQFGAGGSNQGNTESVGGNSAFQFGGSNNTNPSGGNPSAGFNFSASSAPSFNFGGGQPAFSSGEVAPNQNPFNQVARSTTPNAALGGRRRLQARRRAKK